MKEQTRPKRNRTKRKTPISHKATPIDKALLREQLEAYRISNLEKERERIKQVRERTPQQAFEAFLDLWDFGNKYGGKDTWSEKDKLAGIDRYYERVRKLESRRRVRGSTT